MKKVFLIFAATLALVACNDDKETEPDVRFPETQILNCTTGERHTIQFDAPFAWKLTSSANWCRFVQGDDLLYSIAGVAGKQSIQIAISDEGLGHDNISTAHLTLYMEGQQVTLAEVSRKAAGYELQVYDADGNPTDVINIGYADYATFQVQANFAFAATAQPDWAELRGNSLTGAAGTMVTSGIRIVPDGTVEKNECEGTITFQDMKGMASFTVRVVYNGMDRDAISIKQPSGNAWNWTVDADGNTWTHENSTYDRFVTCTIAAYHDDYEIVYVEDTGDGFAIEGVQWMHLNKKTGRITVDATDKARKGYIFAFPSALYEQISDNLLGNLVTTDEGETSLNYRYQNLNLVMHIRQQAPKADDGGESNSEVGFLANFYVGSAWEPHYHNCYRITDKGILDHCEEAIGTREVFLLDKPSIRFNGGFDEIIPYPYLTLDDMSDNQTYFTDYDGNRLDELPEMECHGGHIIDENLDPLPEHWYIGGCKNTVDGNKIFLVLYNNDGSVMKALLIDTKE